MSTIPHTRFERNAIRQGYACCIGVDEVGVGALAGPVVVCAASWDPQGIATLIKRYPGVRDSKIMSALQRERIADVLTGDPLFRYCAVAIEVAMIDKLSIHHATQRGMRHAVANLVRDHRLTRPMVYVDGNREISEFKHPQRTVIGGDGSIFSIACASIVAKVHRDALMRSMAVAYPDYEFQQHKGYGTKLHYERLAMYGPTPLHRRTFRLTTPTK